MQKFLSSVIILASLFTSSLPALAQTDLSQKDVPALSPEEEAKLFPSLPVPQTIPNTTNCFDDYHFGSVQADISPSVMATVPGVPLTFSGQITNDNPYPIVDGAVYVKIFQKQTDDLNSHQNGPLLVDQFFAKENISLKANSSSPFSFAWNIPRNLGTGDYQAATYFVSAKRFNLSGLSFTDDVTGNKADFSIKSDVTNPPAYFNKNIVTLNQKPHKFAIFPLHFPQEENVTAEVELINPSKQDKTITLTWRLSSWDGLRQENQKDEKTETITLKGSETKKVSYTVNKDANIGSVAYLVAEAKDGASKSLLDIRFVREGSDEIRLNFPSITSYPLTQGKETSLFSCVHSTNSPIVKDNTLTLTLKTLSGEIIHQYTYNGDISGEMMGVKESFTPTQTIQDFTLTATLKHNNQVVEEVTQTYSCKALGENCPKKISSATNNLFDLEENSLWLKLILFLVGATLLFFIIRKIVMKKSSSTFSFFFALLMAGSLFIGLGQVKQAEAAVQSPTWTNTVNDWFIGIRKFDNIVGSTPSYSPNSTIRVVDHPTMQVWYYTYAKDTLGNLIPDGATVPVGSQIKFNFKPYDNSDIYWFGAGYYFDSPYGRWIAGAGAPTNPLNRIGPKPDPRNRWFERHTCDPYDWTQTGPAAGGILGTVTLYIPFSVNPPTKNFTAVSSNLSCGTPDIKNSDVLCTVTSAGSISARMVFNETYGRFYYRAYQHGPPPELAMDCFGSNVPMYSQSSSSPSKQWDVNTGSYYDYYTPPNSPYTISIPAKTFNFSFNAVVANQPPTPPTVTDAVNGVGIPNTSYTFTALSTDPDNDLLRYGFDWDKNGTVDQWMPAVGYVASGISQMAPYSWFALNTYTFQVLAQDNKGGVSGWTSHTIRMVGSPLVDLKVNGSDGPVNLTQGQTRNFTWTTADATTCTASSNDIWSGSKAAPSGAESLVAHVSSQSPDHDKLTCTGPGGTSSDSVQVNVACVPSTGAWEACLCPEEIKWRTNIGADCRSSREQGECTSSEKNSCRDFNWREVAP